MMRRHQIGMENMQKKERLKPLSLYGLDLKEALHAMLSVDPRKLQLKDDKAEEFSGTAKDEPVDIEKKGV